MVGSMMVADWSCSQLIGVVESAAQSAVCRPISSVGCGWCCRISLMQLVLLSVTSSWRCSLWGFLGPEGCLDRASLVRFRVPGMYVILNLYLSVRSFKFRSRGFAMSSRQRSLNSFSSGLWSTATIRSLHPRTKCLALSKASATANASPSTGAYRDSAE